MRRFKLFQSIHWRFITIYFLLILIAMQVISVYFNQQLEAHYVNEFTTTLDQQAGLLAYSIQNDIEGTLTDADVDLFADIHRLVDQMFGSVPHAEAQILDQSGIIMTSMENPSIIGQRNNQPEINRALQGTRDDSIRLHPHNGHRMRILALPLKDDTETIGAIYIAASMEDLYETIGETNLILATGTLIALILSGLIGITLSRTITKPIREMTEQTTAMAEGDFTRQVKVYGQDEIGVLAAGINELSQRLHQALADNEEERNKLASILFNMSDGVVASDRRGRIILMNQKAELMLDLHEDEVLGMKLSDVLDFPEEIQQDTLLTESGRFLLNSEQEGQTFILQVNVTPLHSGSDIQGMIAVLQDVTQQEQLEKDRKEFVANVSHELRTPLTTIKSYLEALSDGAKEDEQLLDKFMLVIQNETERMIRLVHDLLHLSKMDTKKVTPQLQETNLNELLQHVVDRFTVPLQQRQLSFELDLQERLPLMYIDQDQIVQMLDNILSNAIKYSFAQGKIYVRAQAMHERVTIEIQDEGIGIPKAELKYIFRRFYRVDKARSRELGGTGLGLAITKEMVLAHGGHIEIDSDIDAGTTVRIILPIFTNKKGQGV